MNKLKRLEACGQSPWLDYLKRSLVESGELRTLIERYADALKRFQSEGDHGISAIYEHLAIAEPAAKHAAE